METKNGLTIVSHKPESGRLHEKSRFIFRPTETMTRWHIGRKVLDIFFVKRDIVIIDQSCKKLDFRPLVVVLKTARGKV